MSCHWLHKWSRWSEPTYEPRELHKRDGTVAKVSSQVQYRCCERCGAVEMREIQ